mmetsp:Transcript_11518/g.13654  ORF Transcript_11518/g.13654 Transcript_11518/m.13654 type:complete len:105 (-) Transcript_11518:515-829(-)
MRLFQSMRGCTFKKRKHPLPNTSGTSARATVRRTVPRMGSSSYKSHNPRYLIGTLPKGPTQSDNSGFGNSPLASMPIAASSPSAIFFYSPEWGDLDLLNENPAV